MKLLYALFLSLSCVLNAQEDTVINEGNFKQEAENVIAHRNFYGTLDSVKIRILKEAIPFGIKANDKKLLATIYLKLARHKYLQYKNNEVFEYLNKVDSIWSGAIDSTSVESTILRSRINIFGLTNDERAFNLLTKAKADALLIDSQFLNNYANIWLGRWYIKLHDKSLNTKHLDTARYYLESAVNFFKNEHFDRIHLSRALRNLSYNEVQFENFVEAENYLIENYELQVKANDSLGIASALSTLGSHSLESGNFQKCIDYMNQARSIYESIGYPDLESEYLIYRDLSLSNGGLENYELAYKNGLIFLGLQERIITNRNLIQANQLDAFYKNKEIRQQLSLVESQKQLVEQQKNNQRNLLLGFLVIASLTALFLYFQFRNRQKTTKKLKELDSFRTNLFTNISHELRTPLTLISGPIDKQLENELLDDNVKHDLKLVQQNSDRLTNLVTQITDLAKIESGQLALKVSLGNLNQLIQNHVTAYTYRASEKNIGLETNIQGLESGYYNEDYFLKILSNILTNSIKYAPDNSTVTFHAIELDGNVSITVANNVVADSALETEKWFNRFYQQNNASKGMGVGLSLVKELVELHKGEISLAAESKRVSMSISIPIDQASYLENEIVEVDNMVSEATQIISETEKDANVILIVDDETQIRNFVVSLFKNDYKVISATNGKEGLTIAQNSIPDLIISDVMMPVMNGIDMTKQLRNDDKTRHIPVFLLTAKVGEQNELKGIDCGASDYIEKPFNHKILKAKVSNALEQRKMLQEHYSNQFYLKPLKITVTNNDTTFIEKVYKILDERLTEPDFNTEAFGKDVGMSRMQLYRKLKAIVGQTPSEFIRMQRLKLAEIHLQKGAANISEIGYLVGFNDPSYFIKCFRELFGCTPKDYLEKNQLKTS